MLSMSGRTTTTVRGPFVRLALLVRRAHPRTPRDHGAEVDETPNLITGLENHGGRGVETLHLDPHPDPTPDLPLPSLS